MNKFKSMRFEEMQQAVIREIQSLEDNANNTRNLKDLLNIFEEAKIGIPVGGLWNRYIPVCSAKFLESDIMDRLQENELMMSEENIRLVSESIDFDEMDSAWGDLVYRFTNEGLKEANRESCLEPHTEGAWW